MQINTNIEQAALLLRQGQLVAFPTETVYGLGADAQNEGALAKIFAVKGRPKTNPLIVHIANLEELSHWAREIPAKVYELAAAFWPGPLTLILKKQANVSNLVTANQDTIALRIPSHPIAQQLLKAFGSGIAAPSANLYTHVSATTADAVREELGACIPLVLDGGDCAIGLESTILDLSSDAPRILRPGLIHSDTLKKYLNLSENLENRPHAPGSAKIHYAPHTPVFVCNAEQIETMLQDESIFPCAILQWNKNIWTSVKNKNAIHEIMMPSNPGEYAHDLYQTLRQLDKQNLRCILVEAVLQTPSWEGIRDRLQKASAKREAS